ncbi:MAG: GTPase Era [Magnetococcales bacterium]|nr:GTPase Era [Magnetococcales bacterium]
MGAQSASNTAAFRSGFIAVIGRPNMGKSTFLNRVLGQKVAIVTPKAQTTRSRILGVCHRKNCQMVFLDTPGIHHAGGNRLNQTMVKTAYDACREVDHILLLVDLPDGMKEADFDIVDQLIKRPGTTPTITLLINKIDDLSADERHAFDFALREIDPEISALFDRIIPISAKHGNGVKDVLTHLKNKMPVGPHYFPEDQITDQPERFIAAEIVREKLFLNLRQELPYDLAVVTESYKEEGKILHLHVAIWVTRDSQKGMVIGRKGAILKKVGEAARKEMERLLNTRIYLQLWVQVKKDWSRRDSMLRELGYLDS